MSVRFPNGVRRRMSTLKVTRREWLSPNLVCVTVAGSDLADFVYQGGDQCFRLFFPRPEQSDLRMPTVSSNAWVAERLATPARLRPYTRNMTVRSFRAAELELDMNIAVHGDTPLSVWVRSVEPGGPAGVFDEGRTYRPRDGARSQLVVADETALAAAMVIAEETPESLPTQMAIEVPTSDDVLDVALPEHVAVTWLPRNKPAMTPGELAAAFVRSLPAPSAPTSVFVAGESNLAAEARRFLTAAGVPKAAITSTGYWKKGRSSHG